MRPYQDIVRAWAAEQSLEDLSPEQRRAIGLIAAGAASEDQLAAVGAEFARGIKSALPHQTRGVVADVVKVAERPNTLRFKFSDETPDRMGDIIRQDGWNFTNYGFRAIGGGRFEPTGKGNPVVLWGHARSDDADADEPIARTVALSVIERATWGDMEFAVEESERAGRKYRLGAAGYIRANSVGFRAGKVYEPESDDERRTLGLGRFGVVFESGHELLENSLCAIPANPSALQASVKSGAITEADADELHAQRTERDWERYLKRRARSVVSMSVPERTDAPTDDRLARALESIAETQRALAPLVQLAPALTALAHCITDLEGCLSAPRQVAQAPAPATKTPALTADEERVLDYLRSKTKTS